MEDSERPKQWAVEALDRQRQQVDWLDVSGEDSVRAQTRAHMRNPQVRTIIEWRNNQMHSRTEKDGLSGVFG